MCQETVRDKWIVRGEKGKQVRLSNACLDSWVIVDVDGCVSDGQYVACDFHVYSAKPLKGAVLEVFIELKGRDVLRAVKQLEATIRRRVLDKGVKYKRHALIAHGKNTVPKPQMSLHKIRFRQELNTTLTLHKDTITLDLCKELQF